MANLAQIHEFHEVKLRKCLSFKFGESWKLGANVINLNIRYPILYAY